MLKHYIFVNIPGMIKTRRTGQRTSRFAGLQKDQRLPNKEQGKELKLVKPIP